GHDPGLTRKIGAQRLPDQGAAAIAERREADEKSPVKADHLLEPGKIHGSLVAAPGAVAAIGRFDYKSRYATDKARFHSFQADGLPAGGSRGRAAQRRRSRAALAHSAARVRALSAARSRRASGATRRPALSGPASGPAARLDTAFLHADEAGHRRHRPMAAEPGHRARSSDPAPLRQLDRARAGEVR